MRMLHYFRCRKFMQTGDLLLWSSGTVLGWLIRKFSGSHVNHAGMVIQFKEFGGLKNRRWTLEYLEHGGEFNLVSERLKRYKGQLWLYRLDPEFNHLREDLAIWAFLNKGKDYDYGSLFKQAIGRVSADAKKFFCSEYYYLALLTHGIVKLQKHAPRPGDLPSLGVFVDPLLIYDSNMK